jgi:hypothetical protein
MIEMLGLFRLIISKWDDQLATCPPDEQASGLARGLESHAHGLKPCGAAIKQKVSVRLANREAYRHALQKN